MGCSVNIFYHKELSAYGIQLNGVFNLDIYIVIHWIWLDLVMLPSIPRQSEFDLEIDKGVKRVRIDFIDNQDELICGAYYLDVEKL